MTQVLATSALALMVATPLPPWIEWHAAPKQRPKEITTVLLQYRIKADALAPSRFVLTDEQDQVSPHITVKNDLPEADRSRLEKMLNVLEVRNVNGVEFQCQGYFEGPRDNVLVVTTVPKITKKGSMRLKEFIKVKR
jgi:hypothetical protein